MHAGEHHPCQSNRHGNRPPDRRPHCEMHDRSAISHCLTAASFWSCARAVVKSGRVLVLTQRPRPEDFLELLKRDTRGRLKIYIGFAAGVGKTYRMLEEAQALKQRGVDVALGLIETHGRADTAALIEGLEYVPRRKIEYRSLVLEEPDVEAIIARHPQVVVI